MRRAAQSPAPSGTGAHAARPDGRRAAGRAAARRAAALFVNAEVRRRGIATAVIEWVAQDAKEHGFPGLYWNTLEDAPARALYNKMGKFHEGLIHYTYRRDAN
ncbi:GNAT family N-acetyltransferase [Streptosporangium sp. CA-115845]|uniref:GNAT family N-acetyltransferase n=1 Tax=Streptosporangium sp. CA-115845 TaxID=3240071 RepID=UPI003D8CCFCF